MKADRLNIRLTEQHKNRLVKIVKAKGSTATQTNVIEDLIDKEFERLKSLSSKKRQEN